MKDNKAFLVIGRDHKILFWSDELAELTGHAAKDMVGGNLDPIIHPNLRKNTTQDLIEHGKTTSWH